MAQIAKLSTKTQLKSPPAKAYDFFKYNMTQLAKVSPQMVKRCEVIEGKEGQVGCVVFFEYVIGTMTSSAKVKTVAVNDKERSIEFECIEGEMLQAYPSFKSRVTTTEGCVEWSIEYVKANEQVPDPEPYTQFAAEVTKILDAYLLSN